MRRVVAAGHVHPDEVRRVVASHNPRRNVDNANSDTHNSSRRYSSYDRNQRTHDFSSSRSQKRRRRSDDSYDRAQSSESDDDDRYDSASDDSQDRTGQNRRGGDSRQKLNRDPKKQRQIASTISATASAPSLDKAVKLLVTNLRSSVSTHDIQNLFQDVGHIVKIEHKVDSRGQSLGTMHVYMSNVHDAENVVQAYHNTEVFGQQMRVTLLKSSSHSATPLSVSSRGAITERKGKKEEDQEEQEEQGEDELDTLENEPSSTQRHFRVTRSSDRTYSRVPYNKTQTQRSNVRVILDTDILDNRKSEKKPYRPQQQRKVSSYRGETSMREADQLIINRSKFSSERVVKDSQSATVVSGRRTGRVTPTVKHSDYRKKKVNRDLDQELDEYMSKK